MGVKEVVRIYPIISRWEFLPASGVAILIGVFLAVRDFSDLLVIENLLYLIEGLIAFFMLFNVGFMINCWADWEVDKEHKTHLSEAVVSVGRKTVGNLVALHIIAAVAISFHLSYMQDRWLILFLVLLGTFLGVAYSVEPFRFKRRGVFHSVMAVPVFAIPGIYSYLLVAPLPLQELNSQVFIFLAFGITLAHYGLVLISQSEDYPEDKKAGLITAAVHMGLKKTLRTSFVLNVVGSIIIIIAFTYWFLEIHPGLLIMLVVLVAGRAVPIKASHALYKKSQGLKTNKAILKEIRAAIKDYPTWHGAGLMVVMFCSLALAIARHLGW